MASSETKPECDYCGCTDGLRKIHDGYGPISPKYTCENCFHEFRVGGDEGPCFDDLPEVPS